MTISLVRKWVHENPLAKKLSDRQPSEAQQIIDLCLRLARDNLTDPRHKAVRLTPEDHALHQELQRRHGNNSSHIFRKGQVALDFVDLLGNLIDRSEARVEITMPDGRKLDLADVIAQISDGVRVRHNRKHPDYTP